MTRTFCGAWREGIEWNEKDYADPRDGAIELILEMVIMVGVKPRWRKTEQIELCSGLSYMENCSCSYKIRTGITNARLKTKGEFTRFGNS